MGEALYRKYRPKKLGDVAGQPHITSTLNNALKQNKISHGYLFAGPRGVGKTTVARILAHEVNNFKYGDKTASVDIIEIDAASNRRIEEIRNIKEKVHITPAYGKYKVYIIDEVHMLTKEAFNALLKTLEEPPKHIIFILATTEANKLPETIISRTQFYKFKEISIDNIVAQLKEIAKKDNITASDEALNLIAKHGKGSFRDSISLLDQASSLESIKSQDIIDLLGIPPTEMISAIIDSLENKDAVSLVNNLEATINNGVNAVKIAEELIEQIKQQVIAGKLGVNELELCEKLLEIPISYKPDQLLEILLLEYIINNISNNKVVVQEKNPKASIKVKPSTKKIIKEETIALAQSSTPVKDVTKESTKNNNNELWQNFLDELKKSNNTLYGVTKIVEPKFLKNKITFIVKYQFHKKRLQEEKNRQIINTILAKIFDDNITFDVQVKPKNTNEDQPNKISNLSANSDTLKTISQVFGGGELMEH
jgi:DNA polymerase-3 subunit gamma/tau